MRLSVLVATAGAALGVAACGSTDSSAVSQTATGPVQTQTQTVAIAPERTDTDSSTTATVTTSAPVPTTVTTATITQPDSGGAGLGTQTTTAAAACTASDLTTAAVPPNGATGTVVLGFTLKNSGAAPCETYGWPGVAFISASGSVVATQTRRTTSDILGSTPPTRFTVAPASEASFRVTVHDSNDQGGEAGCGSYSHLQIIAPNDTAAMTVGLPAGPVEVCGAADVSPLEPGTSATGQ